MTNVPNSYADPGPLGAYSDAARRIADAVTLHLTADPLNSPGKWVAFRLADGECRPDKFDSKRDAIRHCGGFSSLYGFVQILPMGMPYREAESFLRTSRAIADNPNLRWRQTDADAPAEHLEVNPTTSLILPNGRKSRR